jgi:hypothetical protein
LSCRRRCRWIAGADLRVSPLGRGGNGTRTRDRHHPSRFALGAALCTVNRGWRSHSADGRAAALLLVVPCSSVAGARTDARIEASAGAMRLHCAWRRAGAARRADFRPAFASARAFGRRHGFVTACVRQQSRSRAAMGRDRDRPVPKVTRSARISWPHWRRAATSRQRSQVGAGAQTSDAYDAEPVLPAALSVRPIGDRVIRPQLSPRQPHCRELAADHIWQLGQLDVPRADVGWSQATTVGYGSAHGAAPAHRRSEG